MNATGKLIVIAAIGFAAAVAGCSATPLTAGSVAPPVAATVTAQPPTSSRPPPPTVTPRPAPTSTSAPTSAPAAVGAPQTVKASATDGSSSTTAIYTVHSATWSDTSSTSYDLPPKNGGYLTVDVAIEGLTGSTQYYPYIWHAKDAAGRSYEAGMGGPEPALHNGYAEPGDLARGYLTFDMPQGAVTLILGERPGIRWIIPAS